MSKEKATSVQWNRATNIIRIMAAIIYKRLFRLLSAVHFLVVCHMCRMHSNFYCIALRTQSICCESSVVVGLLICSYMECLG